MTRLFEAAVTPSPDGQSVGHKQCAAARSGRYIYTVYADRWVGSSGLAFGNGFQNSDVAEEPAESKR